MNTDGNVWAIIQMLCEAEEHEPKLQACTECGGNGEVEYDVFSPMSFSIPYGDIDTKWGTCETCNGSGEVEVD